MTRIRNQFHFTETIYLCLRSLRGACIVTADSWANSPKGGDAKPPVYGTCVPTTAGLPVRTLAHSDRAGHAPLAGVMSGPNPIPRYLASLPLWRHCIPVQGTWTKQNRFRFSATSRSARVMLSALSPAGVGCPRQARGSVRFLTSDMTGH